VLTSTAAISSWWLPLLAFGFSFLALLALLLLYNKVLASWRAVLCAWLAYVALRILTIKLGGTGVSFVETNLATLGSVLSLEAMIAALASMLVLAIRRDVSVAYVALSYSLGAWLMLRAVRSAGGVLSFLTGSMAGNTSNTFSFGEPVVIGLACMATLGFLTFFPHLIWMFIREMRGN
jgi:hypothetical protein